MLDSLDRIVRPAGALLFSEGDAGSVAYMITRGRIEIFLARNCDRIVLATRGPGEIVGEMAIIDGGPRSASALVVADCELVPITTEQLQYRIAQTDPILRMCLSVAITRCREMVGIIENDGSPAPSSPTGHLPYEYSGALSKLSFESELRRAIANDELELFFQPIVRLPARRLAGFEALARWRHPTRGLLLPAVFIPCAEASGIIVDITEWCLAEVGRIFPQIMTAALSNLEEVDALFMSINISGHDLERDSFAGSVAAMLASSGIAPESIKLEITESVLMKSPEKSVAALEACRRLGVSVAIDDFGTGYSSLSCLSTLPVTTIKIDRSFVSTMNARTCSRKIIGMILGLADTLAVPVIVEGVESQHDERLLADMGCDFAQGYLYGKPAPLADTLSLTRCWRMQSGVKPARPRFRVISNPIAK
jgi:EAL domain-containing protein (putative c-di-GMP-specific phosphodiesterase class I)